VKNLDEMVDRIIQNFLRTGTSDYIGEPVSQLEHSLQCAYFAEKSGHSEEVILASLFHDIGHFFSETEQAQMADLGVVHHEWIGAKLAYDLGFSAKVALLIGYHVDAKRYLAAKKSNYYERLSSASKGTLAFQGGPMSAKEMELFEKHLYFKEILQVRINDEKAKEIDLIIPDIDYYRPLLKKHLAENNYSSLSTQHLTNFVDQQWVAKFKSFVNTVTTK
jgi:predicted HD phosphohydrolase